MAFGGRPAGLSDEENWSNDDIDGYEDQSDNKELDEMNNYGKFCQFGEHI